MVTTIINCYQEQQSGDDNYNMLPRATKWYNNYNMLPRATKSWEQLYHQE